MQKEKEWVDLALLVNKDFIKGIIQNKATKVAFVVQLYISIILISISIILAKIKYIYKIQKLLAIIFL